MHNLLEIKNIEKTFYTLSGEVQAIKNVSFNVYDNEFLCIVGSSGCGKSTLLNIIAGLLNYNGTIFFKEISTFRNMNNILFLILLQ